MTHGTRATYQRDACRCLPCKAANASYQATLRRLKLRGQQPLGSLISTAHVQALVDGMLIEHFTFAEIARRIGLRCQRFRLQTDRVTVRRYLQLRRVYRQAMQDHGST